jgi:hypothetical protein
MVGYGRIGAVTRAPVGAVQQRFSFVASNSQKTVSTPCMSRASAEERVRRRLDRATRTVVGGDDDHLM